VGPPNETNETMEETEPGQGHTRKRFPCPSPNGKRPRISLPESEQMTARETHPRGGAIGSRSSVENDAGRDEEDSTPSPEVVQEEATQFEIPALFSDSKSDRDRKVASRSNDESKGM
jgi:hypothetical protein